MASWIQDRPQSGHYKNIQITRRKPTRCSSWCSVPLPDWRIRPHETSGYFLNENVCKSIHQGWPNLVSTVLDHSPTLSYAGPLQKPCPCVQKTHKAMRGTSSDGLFLSQSATSLSSKFWKQCFAGLENCQLPQGRGDVLELSFSQHRTTATRGASISDLSGFITQHSPQALEGGDALQEHSERFRIGRRHRAVLQDDDQMVVLQRIMGPSVPWTAGSQYHILLVTTLVREQRENVLQGGALLQG